MRAARVFLVSYLATVALSFGAAATAHTPSTYFTQKWGFNEYRQTWAFTAGFPVDSWRDRVRDGVRQWNVIGEPVQFNEVAQVGNFTPPGPAGGKCPPVGSNTIHWRSHDGLGGVYAYVMPCVYVYNGQASSTLANVTMVFDLGESWYIGTGDAPGNQTDLWSIATHEWGHAIGYTGGDRGHFSGLSLECLQPQPIYNQTMCPSYPSGQEYFRSLEVHDRHTFQGAYS